MLRFNFSSLKGVPVRTPDEIAAEIALIQAEYEEGLAYQASLRGQRRQTIGPADAWCGQCNGRGFLLRGPGADCLTYDCDGCGGSGCRGLVLV